MRARLARLRRPLAALFAAAAAGLALMALRPGPGPSAGVLAAARDLPAGTTLGPSDLRRVNLPPAAVPSGALRSGASGRVLAGPMRKGEPLTDARVVGEALLRGYGPGTVASPVRIADPAAVRLLRPGDHIDVISGAAPASAALAIDRGAASPAASPGPDPPPAAAGPRSGTARVVVSGVPVVAVPAADQESGHEGALVVLATDRAQALALAGAGPALSVTITGH